MGISIQERNVPRHFPIKAWVDVVTHPPVATKKYLGVDLGDFGQLAMPGSEILDRMADDGGEANRHSAQLFLPATKSRGFQLGTMLLKRLIHCGRQAR